MTFAKRLRLFLMGVGFGFLILFIFFRDRELGSWTPESRILTAIDSSVVEISDRANCQLSCLGLNEDSWKQIQSAATVNLSESNTRKKPCPYYHLNATFDANEYTLMWEVCEEKEKVRMLSIRQQGVSCNC